MEGTLAALSSLSVLLITCIAFALVVIITRTNDKNVDPPIQPNRPVDPKTVGDKKAPPATYAQIDQVIKVALRKNHVAVVNLIRGLKIKTIKFDDFKRKMDSLTKSQKRDVIATLNGLEPYTRTLDAVGLDAFYASGLLYVMTIDPLAAGRKTVTLNDPGISCPPSWQPCSDPTFANRTPNMELYLRPLLSNEDKEVQNSSRMFCCKYGNAANDPRPEIIARVNRERKALNVTILVVEILAGLIGGLSFAGSVASAIIAVAGGLVDGLGVKDKALGERIANNTSASDIEAAFDSSAPLINCQDTWSKSFLEAVKTANPNGIFPFKYLTGDPPRYQTAYYQAENGCPISVLDVVTAKYSYEHMSAYNKLLETTLRPYTFDFTPKEFTKKLRDAPLTLLPVEKYDPKGPPMQCHAQGYMCDTLRINCANRGARGPGNCRPPPGGWGSCDDNLRITCNQSGKP